MPIKLQLTSNFNKQLVKGKYFKLNMLRSGQVMSVIANIAYYRKILSIGTAGDEQTVQTQIRLLLREQSDQGLHCLPFLLHLGHFY